MSWTEKELEDLELLLPQSKSKKQWQKLYERFPNKIRREVQCKARALIKKDQWNESDDKLVLFLNDLYKGNMTLVQSKFPHKSEVQIQRRIRFLSPNNEYLQIKKDINIVDNSLPPTQQLQNSQEIDQLIENKIVCIKQDEEDKLKVKALSETRPRILKNKNKFLKVKKDELKESNDTVVNYVGKSYLKQALNTYFSQLLKRQRSLIVEPEPENPTIEQKIKKLKIADVHDFHVLHQMISDI